jgi:DNA-binding NarL/FixJ family response regulator
MQNRSVFLVDDSGPVRARLAAHLGSLDGVSVVGEAETAQEAVRGIRRTQPDCVVLDIQLNGSTGMEVLQPLRSEGSRIVFIVFTNHDAPQYRQCYLRAGADCVLDKTRDFGRIKDVVRNLRQESPC